MKKLSLVIAATFGALLSVTGCAVGDEDDRESKGPWGLLSSRLDVAPVDNSLYKDECGSCHFAYQAGLLPARSWEKLMSRLDNHFGENAELDESTRVELTRYLVEFAAEKSQHRRSRAISRSIPPDETPLRITETRYFIRRHDEVPQRLVENNPQVKSFSRCQACHAEAERGSFNEDRVRIPGYGGWEE